MLMTETVYYFYFNYISAIYDVGDVPERRTRRKCQQLENLATAVQTVAKPGDAIVDFCSGGVCKS